MRTQDANPLTTGRLGATTVLSPITPRVKLEALMRRLLAEMTGGIITKLEETKINNKLHNGVFVKFN